MIEEVGHKKFCYVLLFKKKYGTVFIFTAKI